MKKIPAAYYLMGLLSFFYLFLILWTPIDAATINRFNLNQVQAKILTAVIIIPYVVVWLAAAYGYVRIDQYATKIKKSTDGQAFQKISKGIGVLAFSLPVGAILSRFLSMWRNSNPGVEASALFLNELIRLVLLGLAIVFIYQGVRSLGAFLNKRPATPRQGLIWLAFISAGGLFSFTSFTNLETPSDPIQRLSTILLRLFIVVGYLLVWLMGIRTAYNLNKFKNNVKGSIYRQAIGSLALGLGLVVVSSILVQYFTAISARSNSLQLKSLLFMIFIILVVIMVGYGILVRGAAQLKKIEDA